MPEAKNTLFKNSAFTLIELLIAMAISSIMMAVIATAYWVQAQISREQQMVVEMQQNLRSAMYFLERDIMMAGYDDDRNNLPEGRIIAANAVQFTFEFVDDANAVVRIAYSLFDALNDGDADLGRSVNGVAPQAVAENLQTLEFFYTMANGTRTLNPANLQDIRVVGISLLARTASETRAVDRRTYTSLSGATTGPFNNRFQRQLVTAMIRCRNMIGD
ncbi:MAG: prepilin-type N-terminal cleavage/methylation domain-containing protein [Desulfosalsimonadaceae bacterium]